MREKTIKYRINVEIVADIKAKKLKGKCVWICNIKCTNPNKHRGRTRQGKAVPVPIVSTVVLLW